MSNSEKTALKIRPHHGLCIAFFRGEGYSESFTANMTSIISMLGCCCEIELVTAADSICAACPNSSGGRCASEQKVRRYDRQVLDLCGLESGQRIEWSEFARLVSVRIIEAGRLRGVCGDCEWAYICHGER